MQTVQTETSRPKATLSLPVISRVTKNEIVLAVPSASAPGTSWIIHVNRVTKVIRCSCPAHGRCYHQTAAHQVVTELKMWGKPKGTRALPRLAVIDDHDPYADLADLAEKQLAQSQAAFEEVFPELAQVIREEEEALIARYAADQDGHAFRLEQIARFNSKSVGGGM